MSPGEGVIAITGAGGFIGRHLCDHFRRLGWEVRAMMRDTSRLPFTQEGIRPFACDLPDSIPREALLGADIVAHCAYVTRHRDLAEAARVNEVGTRRLLDLTRSAGARFLFLSSQSAHDRAESYYGRSKLALEGALDPGRDLAFRPGLVMGTGPAGLFSRMCESVRRSRVIPLFGGGLQPLQTVHIDDLCEAIGSATRRGMRGTWTVAEPEPLPMRRFLEMLALMLGRRPLFVRVPMTPALVAMKAIESLGIPFPVSSENLLGLRQMRAVDTRRDLEALGMSVRPATVSLEQIFVSHDGGGA